MLSDHLSDSRFARPPEIVTAAPRSSRYHRDGGGFAQTGGEIAFRAPRRGGFARHRNRGRSVRPTEVRHRNRGRLAEDGRPVAGRSGGGSARRRGVGHRGTDAAALETRRTGQDRDRVRHGPCARRSSCWRGRNIDRHGRHAGETGGRTARNSKPPCRGSAPAWKRHWARWRRSPAVRDR